MSEINRIRAALAIFFIGLLTLFGWYAWDQHMSIPQLIPAIVWFAAIAYFLVPGDES